MARKKSPRQLAVANQQTVNPYIRIDDDNNAQALSKAVGSYRSINKTQASHGSYNPFYDYSNLQSGVSGRPGLTRDGYYAFRPAEAPATRFPEIIHDVNNVYKRVGLIRNIIDLMGDFGSGGIRISHPNKTAQKILRNWWAKVGGAERSERWLNLFYREGMVVVTKQMAKINKSKFNQLKKSYAAELDAIFVNPTKNEVPWKYTFIDPTITVPIGGPLVSLMKTPSYAINLPPALKQIIRNPKNPGEAFMVGQLPNIIKEAAQNNTPVPLDPDFTSVYHYKKDDWEAWAYPMIYAVMDDIYALEKLRLADMAALDGAISNIRIFKLGNLEYKIAPSDEAASRLAEVLESHTGVGSMDIVWGPDIELIESKTQVHQFLGEEKYRPSLNAIYAGLGIPPTLTGTLGASGTTNNYVSLKTLIQRLNYGRNQLRDFWMKELTIVQKALGLPLKAEIEFDIENLGNEEAEKALLIQLADRQLISEEILHERFHKSPEMEKSRIQNEEREREKGKRPVKAGPFHKTDKTHELKRVSLQTGQATPGQVGIKLEEVNPGEKKLMDIKPAGPAGVGKKPAGGTGGRPKNSKDKGQRKEKQFKPKTKAMELWASAALEKIGEILQEKMLNHFDKKNLRSLSSEQFETFEMVKFSVLMSLEPHCNIDEKTVASAVKSNKQYNKEYKECKALEGSMGSNLTISQKRDIKAYVYTIYKGEENGEI